MFTLDSDLMGILMALLTFLVPLISALVDRKRKKRKGEQPNPVQEPDSQQERLNELEEMFDLLIGKESNEPQIEPQIEPVEEIKIAEEGESTIVNNISQVVVQKEETQKEETQKEEAHKELKERLKENPKDLVIFSEILNPKFKEY